MGLGVLGVIALYILRQDRRKDPNTIAGQGALAPDPPMAGYEEDSFYNPTYPGTPLHHTDDGDPSSPNWRARQFPV